MCLHVCVCEQDKLFGSRPHKGLQFIGQKMTKMSFNLENVFLTEV